MISELNQRIDWLFNSLFCSRIAACCILGISATSQLHRYVKHKALPSCEVLQRAGQLGISLNWLVLGEGPQWTESENAKKVQSLLASGEKLTIEYYYRELAAKPAPSTTQPHKDLP